MTLESEMEPILIAFFKQNKLQFSTNTFRDIVSKVGARPVSLISISHPILEQRNQIFNQCLKYLQTYKVCDKEDVIWKSKSDSEVKGIYLWSEPIIIRKSSQEVAVLLMETNICFDDKTATREDLLLLALNCVLASTLIGDIPEKSILLSDKVLEFLQLMAKYSFGGIGEKLDQSFLNLVLVIRDWTKWQKYPFGYHDSATCPPNGNKSINFKKDRLNVEPEGEPVIVFKNQYFLDSFQKISFCLMPGNESEVMDQNANVSTFGNTVNQIVGRLFHPSSIVIKRIGGHKYNGHELVRLFDKISTHFAETDDQNLFDNEIAFKSKLQNVIALSNGFHFYVFQMNRLIEDNKYMDKSDLILLHNESKNNALKLFENIKGVTDQDQTEDKQVLRDRFYDLLENEIQNIWQFLNDLNQMKCETLSVKHRTQKMVDDMVERVVHMKKKFYGLQNTIDSEISQLIGFSLESLNRAVQSSYGLA